MRCAVHAGGGGGGVGGEYGGRAITQVDVQVQEQHAGHRGVALGSTRGNCQVVEDAPAWGAVWRTG